MSEGIRKAKKCFEDNFNSHSNPETAPEQYNLYKGLYGLAEALEEVRLAVDRIEARLIKLEES